MRETTISRSASLLASLAICMLLLLKSLHVLVQPVEVLVPVLLEADDPIVHRLEAARVETVEPLLPGLADPHESHFAKHAQVLRRARLRDAQCARELVDRTLAAFEKGENSPPLRLGNCVERIGGCGGSCHEAQYMSISAYVKIAPPTTPPFHPNLTAMRQPCELWSRNVSTGSGD